MNRLCYALILGLLTAMSAFAQIVVDDMQTSAQVCVEDGYTVSNHTGLFGERHLDAAAFFNGNPTGCIDIANGKATITADLGSVSYHIPAQDLTQFSAFSVSFSHGGNSFVEIGAYDAAANELFGRLAYETTATQNRAILFVDTSSYVDWSGDVSIFINYTTDPGETIELGPLLAHELANDADGDGVLNAQDPEPNSDLRQIFTYQGQQAPSYVPNLILDSGLSLTDSIAQCADTDKEWQFNQCVQTVANQQLNAGLLTQETYDNLLAFATFRPTRPYQVEDHPKLDYFQDRLVLYDDAQHEAPNHIMPHRTIRLDDPYSHAEMGYGALSISGSATVSWWDPHLVNNDQPFDLSALSAISLHTISQNSADVYLWVEDAEGRIAYGEAQPNPAGQSQRTILFAPDRFNGVNWSRIARIVMQVYASDVTIQSVELHYDATDRDGDGVFNDVDPEPDSNTFIVTTWRGRPIPNTFVPNVMLDEGTSITDLINACEAGSPMEWQFDGCIANSTQNLVNQGYLDNAGRDAILATTAAYRQIAYLSEAHAVLDDFSEGVIADEVTWTIPHAIFDTRTMSGNFSNETGAMTLSGDVIWSANNGVDLSHLSALSFHYYSPSGGGSDFISAQIMDGNGNSAYSNLHTVRFDSESRIILHNDPTAHDNPNIDWSQIVELRLTVNSGEGFDMAYLYPVQMHESASDADGDGILNGSDPYPNSDLSMLFNWRGEAPSVFILNDLYEDGSTLMDRVMACTNGPAKPWQFNQCIQSTTQTLVNEGNLTSEQRTAILALTSDYGQPKPQDDSYLAVAGQTLMVDANNGVLANDVDLEGDTLEAHLEQGPASGSLSLFRDGSFHYTPAAGFSGEVSFIYRCWDGSQRVNATVTIYVSN